MKLKAIEHYLNKAVEALNSAFEEHKRDDLRHLAQTIESLVFAGGGLLLELDDEFQKQLEQKAASNEETE